MKTKLSTPAMSCDHCVMRIKKALNASDAAHSVEVDLETKTVTVTYDSEQDLAEIKAVLDDIGYPAAETEA
jgi:copper chaperone CopZ